MALGFALAGSFLGLHCMIRARNTAPGRERNKWLILAALAIGGIGIWMMHFTAMIGFTVTAGVVRYDLAITAASLIISIASVAFGLFIVGSGEASIPKILLGGPLTGLGVVSMHYTGMAAVNLSGSLSYDTTWVIVSVAIAIVAATAALFFTAWVSGRGSLFVASGIMAVAVSGMHYSGMGAISVTITNRGLDPVPGVDPLLLLIPILLLATIVLIVLIAGVLGGRDETTPYTATGINKSRSDRPRHTARASEAPSFWNTDTGSRSRRVPVAAAARSHGEDDPRLREPAVLPRPRVGSDGRRHRNRTDWE